MIYDWAREQAVRNGNRIAITLYDENITYRELENRSNGLAERLTLSGLKPGDRVGLLLEKTPATIVAMLGISKAGGVYVPLDIHSPQARLQLIIQAANLQYLFLGDHDSGLYPSLIAAQPDLRFLPWIWWSQNSCPYTEKNPPLFCLSDATPLALCPKDGIRNPDHPAHILFTSGSTGQPKGVVITHRNIETFIEWAVRYFDMKPGEHTSCHSPFHFDLSTFDIYGAFASGARLHLVPKEISIHPRKLSDFILQNRLNQWFSVPSVLSYLARFQAIPSGGFPDLKRLLWCGEVFPIPALQYWMRSLPHVTFTNLYGPTEATIASSYHTLAAIPEERTEVPIGRACDGEKLLVLNASLQPVQPGEVGDLYIGGSGLSPGYWRDESKTAAAFIRYTDADGRTERIYKTGDLASLDHDGLVLFHGRSDDQIKSRGYRIELGEIEAALGNDEGTLREYAVVPIRKGGFEGTSIGCAYVAAGCEQRDLAPLLKDNLSKHLPLYMIPQFWKAYDTLPRNANGKIDRKALSNEFERGEPKSRQDSNTRQNPHIQSNG
ncbi:MAG: amino acid adenylation domain-containing protein [Bacteroidota bacterium]